MAMASSTSKTVQPARELHQPRSGITWFARWRKRLNWRRNRSQAARVTVVNQFFPPDYAATGQLLEDLTRRLAASRPADPDPHGHAGLCRSGH